MTPRKPYIPRKCALSECDNMVPETMRADARHCCRAHMNVDLQRRWALANERRRVLGYNRNWQAVLRLAVLEAYGGPVCERCGEDDVDVLQLDHIEPCGRAGRVTGYSFYVKLRNEGYPPGFQVLCANCNVKKEMERRRSERDDRDSMWLASPR